MSNTAGSNPWIVWESSQWSRMEWVMLFPCGLLSVCLWTRLFQEWWSCHSSVENDEYLMLHQLQTDTKNIRGYYSKRAQTLLQFQVLSCTWKASSGAGKGVRKQLMDIGVPGDCSNDYVTSLHCLLDWTSLLSSTWTSTLKLLLIGVFLFVLGLNAACSGSS